MSVSLVALFLVPHAATTSITVLQPAPAPLVSLETLIREAFPYDANTMLQIAICESGMKQFKDNSNEVVQGPTQDYGLFQIHYTNIPKAKELGYDVMTTEGNIKMAQYLYKHGGKNHWVCYTHGMLRPLKGG